MWIWKLFNQCLCATNICILMPSISMHFPKNTYEIAQQERYDARPYVYHNKMKF